MNYKTYIMAINKEMCEYMDAVSRELGEAMSPYEELMMLGFDVKGFSGKRDRLLTHSDKETTDDMEDDYDFEDDGNVEEIVDDEYDFEDENEEYSMLSGILRLNNDRRKYFA